MPDEKKVDIGRPGPPKGDPENPSVPGESSAGRGGIISPGGLATNPIPEEDPRDDSGIPHKEPKK